MRLGFRELLFFAVAMFPVLAVADMMSIIGENQIQEFFPQTPKSLRLARQIVKLTRPLPWIIPQKRRALCSGIALGDHLILTAGHCIRQVNPTRAHHLPCTDDTWIFGDFLGSLPQEKACSTVIYAQNDPLLDVALVHLGSPHSPAVHDLGQRLQMIPAAPINLGSKIIVLGYPGGNRLSTSGDCRITEVGPEGVFFHDCDTEPGSSGSPILDAKTGRIIGIHVSGLETKNRGFSLMKIIEHFVKQDVRLPDSLTKINLKPYDHQLFNHGQTAWAKLQGNQIVY